MSELSEVLQRVGDIFDALNIEVPSEDTDLFESGLLDSLTFVELLVRVEDNLGITVSLEQLEPHNFRSIRHIALFVITNQEADHELEDVQREHPQFRTF